MTIPALLLPFIQALHLSVLCKFLACPQGITGGDFVPPAVFDDPPTDAPSPSTPAGPVSTFVLLLALSLFAGYYLLLLLMTALGALSEFWVPSWVDALARITYCWTPSRSDDVSRADVRIATAVTAFGEELTGLRRAIADAAQRNVEALATKDAEIQRLASALEALKAKSTPTHSPAPPPPSPPPPPPSSPASGRVSVEAASPGESTPTEDHAPPAPRKLASLPPASPSASPPSPASPPPASLPLPPSPASASGEESVEAAPPREGTPTEDSSPVASSPAPVSPSRPSPTLLDAPAAASASAPAPAAPFKPEYGPNMSARTTKRLRQRMKKHESCPSDDKCRCGLFKRSRVEEAAAENKDS